VESGERSRRTFRLETVGPLLITGIVVAISGLHIDRSFQLIPTAVGDVDAYWDAAIRLRTGEALYVAASHPLDPLVYRYSPWFAWSWIPLTYLSRDAIEAIWRVLMVFATIAAIVPVVRPVSWAGVAAGALIGWLTFQTALSGNVQPLLIAGLVWNAERRAGPIWIAIAASLKFVALLYVAVYASRREWQRCAVALALTAALTAPTFLYDLSEYTFEPGTTFSLFSIHPAAWAIGVVLALAVTLVLSANRHAGVWLAGSVAVLLAYPQAHMSYASHLLTGVGPGGSLAERHDRN
jgi:hypothetical protein